MVVVHTYCSVFSLRLGGIIIGFGTLFKSGIWIILLTWALESGPDFTNFVAHLLEQPTVHRTIAEKIYLVEHLTYYLIGLLTFYVVEILICMILIVGAYQCKRCLIYPFLCSYIIYALGLCTDLSFLYLITVHDEDRLQFAIIYWSLNFFLIVYCIYTWCSLYSLVQVIDILHKQIMNSLQRQLLKQAGILPFSENDGPRKN